MKRLFLMILAVAITTAMMAQHGTMTFAGISKTTVLTTDIDNPSDTIIFTPQNLTIGELTLPEMRGMSTIPSFTIKNITFAIDEHNVVSIPTQEFSATVLVDGEEKAVVGSSLRGMCDMEDHSLNITATFKYGAMPFEMTYTIMAFYVKPVTNSIEVTVGGAFTYTNESVTYNVRRYTENKVEKLDVEVPAYTLGDTMIGNLSIGTYTVKGLTYDSEKGGFYRDYCHDGLKFYFSAEQNGVKTMDGEYAFNENKENNILVKYDGNNVESIVNKFQMGSMPFGIVAIFNNVSDGILETIVDLPQTNNNAYNLSGQRVGLNAKGILIINGKKYLKR